MMQSARWLAVLGLSGCLLGCQASEAGLDPPADDVFYPTGLAVDPRGDVLYVTNGNSDLLYNGGSLLALDLTRLRADLAAFEASGETPAPLDGGERTACRRDATVPWVLECRTPRYALASQTIKLGNFAGQIAVAGVGGAGTTARLFIPVRGEPSLTWVNAQRVGGELELDCGNRGPLDRCSDVHRLAQLGDPVPPDPAAPTPETLPGEPFGVFADEAIGTVYVTSFAIGAVSLFDIHRVNGGLPEFVDLRTDILPVDSAGRSGTVAVAVRPCRLENGVPVEGLAPAGPCDPAELTDGSFIYATSLYSPDVAVLTLRGLEGPCDPALGDADPCVLQPRDLRLIPVQRVVVNGAVDPGNDTRGLAFQEDGMRAFVVDRRPPGLVVIDTSIKDGLPRNEVMDAVPVCSEPSLLYVRTIAGVHRAYVVCFASGSADVVDLDSLQVIDAIALGQGPNAMAFAVVDGERPLGFVANYVDNDIGVIDLLPSSPTENQVIGRIGYPASSEVQ